MTRQPISHFTFFGLFALFLLLLVGCGSDPGDVNAGIPTIASIFETETPFPTSTPRPTRTPMPTATPTIPPRTETLIIYDDALQAGWTPEFSQSTFYDFENTEFIYSGSSAIKIVPRVAFAFQENALTSRFLVVLTRESGLVFEREQIDTISFWLNPGDNIITPDDLAFAAQGSNDFTYWVEGDESARVFEGPTTFSEELLFFLDVTRSIPPDTWVKIEYEPNELQFGTPYTYLTGFYMTNASGFVQPYYIDQIEITYFLDEAE